MNNLSYKQPKASAEAFLKSSLKDRKSWQTATIKKNNFSAFFLQNKLIRRSQIHTMILIILYLLNLLYI